MTALPRLLFVCHNIVPRQPFGGVEVYQQIVLGQLSDRFDILTFVTGEDPKRPAYELLDAKGKLLDRFPVTFLPPEEMLRHQEVEHIFSTVIRRYNVYVVHFQHFIKWVPSLPMLAKALGVQTLWTAHEYYTICPMFNLIDQHGKSCLEHLEDTGQCDGCLERNRGIPPGSQLVRRNAFAEALRHIDVMLFPSETARDLVARVYPLEVSRAKTEIVGYPIPEKPPADPALRSMNPLSIAVYGNFSFNKGAEMLMKVFKHFAQGPLMFHLIGRIDAPYDRQLAAAAFPHVVCHGAFKPGSPPAALAQSVFSMHLSNWPETYCIALSEAWQLGLVPIVTDIGALGARVKHGENGFKVPVDNAAATIKLLEDIIAQPELIARAQAGISEALFMTTAQHCDGLVETYSALLPAADKAREQTPATLLEPNKVNNLADIGLNFMPHYWWPPAGSPQNPSAVTLKTIIVSVIVRYYYLHTTARTISAVRQAILAHNLMSRSAMKIDTENRKVGPLKLAGGTIIFVFGLGYDCVCLAGWIAWRVARRTGRLALRKFAAATS